KGEGDRDSRQPGSSPEKASCPPLAGGSWGERPEPIRALHPCTNGKGQRRGAIPSPWGEGQGEGDRDSRQRGSSPEKARCPQLAHGSWRERASYGPLSLGRGPG